jgi:hypothetical protein
LASTPLDRHLAVGYRERLPVEMKSVALAMLVASAAQAQAPTHSRCDAVTMSPLAGRVSSLVGPVASEGTVVGIAGDRVRWVKAGVFVNDQPVSDLCRRPVHPPFPIPPDVPIVEIVVPAGQLFVVSEESAVRPGQDIVVRHFGLVPESTVVTAAR